MVIIINLAVSLFVALFLVPALMDKFGIYDQKRNVFAVSRFLPGWWTRSRFRGKRSVVYLNRFFERLIRSIYRHRAWAILVLILAFGLPVFKLPEKVEGEGFWATATTRPSVRPRTRRR